jgi:hypothetical protein
MIVQQLVLESCFFTSLAVKKYTFDGVALVVGVALVAGVELAVGVAVGVCDCVAAGVTVDAFGVGTAVTLTTGAFFQIDLLPDLVQIYLTLLTTFVEPTLVQLDPATVAELA